MTRKYRESIGVGFCENITERGINFYRDCLLKLAETYDSSVKVVPDVGCPSLDRFVREPVSRGLESKSVGWSDEMIDLGSSDYRDRLRTLKKIS